MTLLPVIMAGGSGTRLWPLSRELHPKQFLSLMGEETMLQQTLSRLQGLPATLPLVVCNEAHRFLVAEQLRQKSLLGKNILLEPASRNTAPAIVLAALHAMRAGDDPLLLVLAADHVIADAASFQKAIQSAIPHAVAGELVTFGIVATHPETGYGYIRRGTPMDASAFKVAEFIEKPPRAKAEEYLAAGGFDWNAGLFLFKASRLIEEIGLFRPDVLGACQAAMNKASQDLDFFRVDAEAFARCPEVSVDYAVMEKTQRAVVVPMEVGWNDIGAFSAIWDILPKDEAGNVSRGDILSHDSRNNLFFAENAMVAAVGVEDLIVVQTKDAILVASRHQAQEVKNIVARIKQAGRTEHQLHREVHRPWGKYDSVDAGKRYQVKRITVLPGGKLSVQMHHHRAEHWVVVSGVARVTLDGVERLLAENESIYLPIGAVHALENPGKVPLEIIEVQVGSYLGEDDIVRFEDRYGRK